MKIGIYGGSFSPPHRGHTDSSITAAGALGLDKLIVVPSGMPPHKNLPQDSPSPQQRYEMTYLAFEGCANTEVSDIELRRGGVSYTIDTARAIGSENPGAELYLITGADMFKTVRQWKDADELLRIVKPVVTFRSDGERDVILKEIAAMKALGIDAVIVENNAIDISSSELRELLSRRIKPWHIDERVYSYIIENGLYGAKPDFDWLRLRAYRMLDEGRIRHVAGCEETAVRLAERWGANPTDAREAAILHDITKRLDVETQLKICREYGVQTDELERANPKMLHSKTAAAFSRRHFCVSDAVESAIRWHTTGCADMTLLEKIIYLADYMEPNRKFEGVDEMRRLAFSDIDKALIMGMEMSIEDLTSRGISPHPTTKGALDFLKEKVEFLS